MLVRTIIAGGCVSGNETNRPGEVPRVLGRNRPKAAMLHRFRSQFDRPGRAPFRFSAARHDRGELMYHDGVPVLRVAGTAEEIGRQLAVLSVRPAPRLLGFPEDLLQHRFKSRSLARLLARRATVVGGRLLNQFPDEPRRELEAMVAAGLDRDR